jgi:glycosyltransferase involved in cell wall biosynthesis
VALYLAKGQRELGCNAKIWCLDNAEDIHWASETSGLPTNCIEGFALFGPRMLWFSPQMERVAASPKGRIFDIVHQHGLWTGVSRATNVLRKKQGIPSVVAPHGSLNQWALNLSRWKKRIALVAYEDWNLHNATCLHATAETEAADFRKFGLTNPIAVIPNGISEKWFHTKGNGDRFRNQYAIPAEFRILFFLSRITPKKGLLMLIEAIKAIKADFADWLLVIAGIDEFGHKAEVEARIEKLDLKNKIKIIGPLFDQIKSDAFAAADLFILPSYSEGAPIVILDCLAAGVPVITTKASPWEELNIYDCGWWVDINTDAICNALRHAVNLSQKQLVDMGQRGRKLVASKYTWAKLAQKTIELYCWLFGWRERPEFVLLD